jgi:ABC-type Fe3+ transport system substrate-binding protein
LRLANEARAGKAAADVYDGTTVGEALKRQGLAEHWIPDEALAFPANYRDPDGYWVAQNFYLVTAAYNTNLVSPGTEPKRWDDLLHPQYRGQIAWAGSASVSAGAGFVGIVLKQLGNEKGRAYLAKLARQKIAAIDAAARVVVDQLIAGEYAIALQIFPEHADESAAKGAPVKWIAMAPGMSAIVSTTGMVKSSPHPDAARLFLDYMISEEGQKIFRDAFYNPANPKVSPLDAALAPDRNAMIFLTPAEVVDAMPQWMKVYNEFFR